MTAMDYNPNFSRITNTETNLEFVIQIKPEDKSKKIKSFNDIAKQNVLNKKTLSYAAFNQKYNSLSRKEIPKEAFVKPIKIERKELVQAKANPHIDISFTKNNLNNSYIEDDNKSSRSGRSSRSSGSSRSAGGSRSASPSPSHSRSNSNVLKNVNMEKKLIYSKNLATKTPTKNPATLTLLKVPNTKKINIDEVIKNELKFKKDITKEESLKVSIVSNMDSAVTKPKEEIKKIEIKQPANSDNSVIQKPEDLSENEAGKFFNNLIDLHQKLGLVMEV